eukprot:TRINITY_DN21417_c0_g1_i4.p1 TRINITY_DN21417_c0_g1~~TRINITY_DN21417_c0_g1_i4.p1  ORF type:complete len:389 (+),score=84.15 TRINITY_DN21417_c0_g1_i4:152-1168(+)
MLRSLVGSEMCIRDRYQRRVRGPTQSNMHPTLLLLGLAMLPLAASHGHITLPPSRHGGRLEFGGHCNNNACMWFSQPTSIPSEPTLPHHMRTYNLNVKTGEPGDWSASMPWRAPGSAPVQGSGCGVGGGNHVPLPNGGELDGAQGMDGLSLPKLPGPGAVWPRGSTQQVGFGILANHGGGYSWRLCKADGEVNEACFQQNVLRFAGDSHTIRYSNLSFVYNKPTVLPPFSIPRKTTTEGTWPVDSEWARIPMPGCRLCDQSVCGSGLYPNLTDYFESPLLQTLGYRDDHAFGGLKWFEQQMCSQTCSGFNITTCPPGMLQFDEPVNGISGYTLSLIHI